MESPLEVLSRAATMVQDSATDTRLTSKELPTTKWRRDRRIRMSSEYHSPGSPNVKPLSESNSTNSSNGSCSGGGGTSSSTNGCSFSNGSAVSGSGGGSTTSMVIETPLDMSVSAKPRTPPPPYREPLPGSTFANTLARPSVITQAPRREAISSNQENKDTAPAVAIESISMIDPVIDEHFRRSLGADYMVLFGNKKPSPPTAIVAVKPTRRPITTTTGAALAVPASPAAVTPSPTPPPAIMEPAAQTLTPLPSPAPVSPRVASPPAVPSPPNSAATAVVVVTAAVPPAAPFANDDDSVAMSVDDHFAKALGGDTWKQLQRSDSSNNKNDDASRHCVKH